MNYEHPFPRVSGYLRVCDIMKVDIAELILVDSLVYWRRKLYM